MHQNVLHVCFFIKIYSVDSVLIKYMTTGRFMCKLNSSYVDNSSLFHTWDLFLTGESLMQSFVCTIIIETMKGTHPMVSHWYFNNWQLLPAQYRPITFKYKITTIKTMHKAYRFVLPYRISVLTFNSPTHGDYGYGVIAGSWTGYR